MNKTILSLSFTLLLSGISPAQATEDLQPQHLQRIEALQRRADILAVGTLGSGNYYLAKARTWLDFALSEYYDKETSGIVSAATEQAETLLDALEKKQPNIPLETPRQLTGSEEVRVDLWEKIAALKNHANFSCGQRKSPKPKFSWYGPATKKPNTAGAMRSPTRALPKIVSTKLRSRSIIALPQTRSRRVANHVS